MHTLNQAHIEHEAIAAASMFVLWNRHYARVDVEAASYNAACDWRDDLDGCDAEAFETFRVTFLDLVECQLGGFA